MLLEALEWLGRELIVDSSLKRLARQADKFSPGAGALVYKLSAGAQGGAIVGGYAGRQTAANIERGIPSTVGLERTPEIAMYESSALGSTRII